MKIVLDPRARLLDGGRTLLGGDPWRVLRLTEAGAAVVRELLAGGAEPGDGGGPAQALARRLIEAGLAHPRATPVACDEVTVVIPVRDRAVQLDRCLASLLAADGPGRVIVVDDSSRDPGAVAAVCGRAGCELIRRERPGGPGAARNTALEAVETGLVALLDSDCVPEPGWLSLLCGVLAADPGLGGVGPRVRPVTSPGSALTRFTAVRSPLDLGPCPSLVRPGGRTAYLPTAALVARREALAPRFDPALRYGEDVDLVWRMIDRGWSMRYEPAAVVWHDEPERLRPWLARRFRYGSSAGPLARRHPERLAPVAIHPRSAAVLGAAAVAVSSRRVPSAAAAVPVALHVLGVVRSLGRHGVPPRVAAPLALQGIGESGAALGRAETMLGPVALAAALVVARTQRRTRRHSRAGRAALALALASPVRDYARLRPALDPVRFAALALADDVAYGSGVWAGSLRARTWRPLRPRISRRGPDQADFLRSSGEPMATPDPYVTLGLSPTASDEDLRTAYRRLVQLHHPDHNHGSRESALRFAEVQEAYAHVKLLRKQSATAGASSSPNAEPGLEARLRMMENELRAAREQREKAAREAAQEAAGAAARAARHAQQRPTQDERASDEELGYYTTNDSFSKILDDFADEVTTRFSEIHPPTQDGGTGKRRPRSVSDWIDEIGSRLTGESPRKQDE